MAVQPRRHLAAAVWSKAFLAVVAHGGSATGGSALGALSIVLTLLVVHGRLAPGRRNQTDARCPDQRCGTKSEILSVFHGILQSPSTEFNGIHQPARSLLADAFAETIRKVEFALVARPLLGHLCRELRASLSQLGSDLLNQFVLLPISLFKDPSHSLDLS